MATEQKNPETNDNLQNNNNNIENNDQNQMQEEEQFNKDEMIKVLAIFRGNESRPRFINIHPLMDIQNMIKVIVNRFKNE